MIHVPPCMTECRDIQVCRNAPAVGHRTRLHVEGRARLLAGEPGPLFLADWMGPVFLHFAVPAERLGGVTPYPLDLWEGVGVVSLVAFTMGRLRLARLPRLSGACFLPFRRLRFLNLRAYVRVGSEPGITFLTEWISSRTQAWLGPWLYGLPYRWGAHTFCERGPECGLVRVRDRTGPDVLAFEWRRDEDILAVSGRGSFDEFVLERHTCFLGGRGCPRLFRIWHPPWRRAGAGIRGLRDDLLRRACPEWWGTTVFLGAHVADGIRDVWMGRPLAGIGSLGRAPAGGRVGGATGLESLPPRVGGREWQCKSTP